MKKIFTLLFAVGMLSLAQAQPGTRDNRQPDQRNDQRNDQQYDQRNGQQNDQQFGQNDFDKGYDKGRFIKENDDFFGRDNRFNDRFSMERKMKMKISMINQEYDYKIQRVRRNFFMTWYEKQRQIRFLENERRWEINMVYAKFNNYRFDDHNRGHGHNGHY
jgi:hypothetical protein